MGRCMMLPDIVGIGHQLLHRRVPEEGAWVEAPQLMLPTTEEIAEMPTSEREQRARFYLSAFLLTYGVTLVVGTAIMKVGPKICGERRDVYEPMGNTDSEDEESETLPTGPAAEGSLSATRQRILFGTVFGANLACCLTAAIASLATNRLSKDTGLDWEVYYLLFVINCTWLIVQAAVAVFRLRGRRKFSLSVFAECTIVGTWPILSDAYDTLKDVLFGALCIQSEYVLLKIIGAASWMYLILIHVYFARDDNCVADLILCYLCVLMAPTTSADVDGNSSSISYFSFSFVAAWCASASDTVLPLLYKQVTPTKRHLLLYENVPQAVFAVVYLVWEDGGSILVALLNLAIPALQIFLTYTLFMPLRMKVAPFFAKKLDQAVEDGNSLMEARVLQETELCDDPQLLGAVLHNCRSWPGSGALELSFADGKLMKVGADALVEGLAGHDQLRELRLDLGGNGLGDDFAGALGFAISRCPHVDELVLSLGKSGLGPSGAALLAASLSRCERLSKLDLDLSGNGLKDEGADALGENLARCRSLRELTLRLSGNGITAKAAKELVAYLSRCDRLASLDLILVGETLTEEGAGEQEEDSQRYLAGSEAAQGPFAWLLADYLARLRQLQSLVLRPGGASAEEWGSDPRTLGNASVARLSRPHDSPQGPQAV
eukprot:s1593_g2.t1